MVTEKSRALCEDRSSHFNNQRDFPSVTLAFIARDAFFFSPDALEFGGREEEEIQIVLLCYHMFYGSFFFSVRHSKRDH